jgi:hypothetical protein
MTFDSTEGEEESTESEVAESPANLWGDGESYRAPPHIIMPDESDKSSFRTFDECLADTIRIDLGFEPSSDDPGVWMRYSHTENVYDFIGIDAKAVIVTSSNAELIAKIILDKFKLELQDVGPIDSPDLDNITYLIKKVLSSQCLPNTEPTETFTYQDIMATPITSHIVSPKRLGEPDCHSPPIADYKWPYNNGVSNTIVKVLVEHGYSPSPGANYDWPYNLCNGENPASHGPTDPFGANPYQDDIMGRDPGPNELNILSKQRGHTQLMPLSLPTILWKGETTDEAMPSATLRGIGECHGSIAGTQAENSSAGSPSTAPPGSDRPVRTPYRMVSH